LFGIKEARAFCAEEKCLVNIQKSKITRLAAIAVMCVFAVDCDSMISAETIEKAVRTLAEAVNPTKIILFGSYARGDADDDSDIDLLVVEPNVTSKRDEMVRLRGLLRPFRIPVDVIVVSEEEFNDWAHIAGTVLYWASREGKILHEAAR
jgi:predicted nucleotidyltransferase